MRSKVLTMYLDTWYGSGVGTSSERMFFGNGLMEELGFDEIHIPLELWRDDPAEFDARIKRTYPQDWAFIVPYTDVMYSLSDLLKHVPLVAWMCDDVWRYSSFGRYWAQVASIMATTSAEAFERYGDKGVLTNWACRPEWAAYKSSVKESCASFHGQLYGRRSNILDLIRESGDVGVSVSNTATVLSSEREYFEDMSASAFSLCLTGSSHGPAQMKSRLFEPQILGTILVTEPVPGLENYWSPGEECIVFHSPASAQEQMRSLLSDKTRLEAMNNAAFKRAVSEHTYAHRFAPILDKIGVTV